MALCVRVSIVERKLIPTIAWEIKGQTVLETSRNFKRPLKHYFLLGSWDGQTSAIFVLIGCSPDNGQWARWLVLSPAAPAVSMPKCNTCKHDSHASGHPPPTFQLCVIMWMLLTWTRLHRWRACTRQGYQTETMTKSGLSRNVPVTILHA